MTKPTNRKTVLVDAKSIASAAPELLDTLSKFLFDFGKFDTDAEVLSEFRRLRKLTRKLIVEIQS